jgi:DNA-binding NarL/FixJ family response regulator
MDLPARSPTALRVLIADDSEIYRNGLARAISATPDLDLVAAVDGGLPAVSEAARLGPRVVVLDYRMPDLDGLSAAVLIHEADPTCRVLLLSAFAEELLDRLEAPGGDAGRSAFDAVLGKDTSRREIVDRVRALGAADPA